MLSNIFSPIISRSPALKRVVWQRWYQFLASGYKQEDWTFMNYGFADKPEVSEIALQPADEADRCSIQLYHRVVGGVDVRDRVVLEVGSGRGGGTSYIARYLNPQAVLGVDYSEKAVALSQTRFQGIENLTFAQGDAEALPCADATFDAVSERRIVALLWFDGAVLREVNRVLKPGGHFLWADMRHPDQKDVGA